MTGSSLPCSLDGPAHGAACRERACDHPDAARWHRPTATAAACARTPTTTRRGAASTTLRPATLAAQATPATPVTSSRAARGPRPAAIARQVPEGSHRIEPVPGRMVAFPGWLPHSVQATPTAGSARTAGAVSRYWKTGLVIGNLDLTGITADPPDPDPAGDRCLTLPPGAVTGLQLLREQFLASMNQLAAADGTPAIPAVGVDVQIWPNGPGGASSSSVLSPERTPSCQAGPPAPSCRWNRASRSPSPSPSRPAEQQLPGRHPPCRTTRRCARRPPSTRLLSSRSDPAQPGRRMPPAGLRPSWRRAGTGCGTPPHLPAQPAAAG